MELLFTISVEPDGEDGGYVATVRTLPGVVGQGETEMEAVEDVTAALQFTLESTDLAKNSATYRRSQTWQNAFAT